MRTTSAGLRLLAVASIAAVGAACNQGPPVVEKEEATELFERAVDTTREVGTFHADLELELESSAGTQTLVIDAALDLDEHSGEVTAGPEDNPELTTLVLQGERAWVKIEDESVTSLLPEGAEFVEGTRAEMEELDVVQPLDESFASLFYLEGAEDIRSTGTEAVGDTEVAVYEFTVDVEEAIDEAPDDLREAVENTMIATGEAELDVEGEVSIDGDERVRRLDLQGDVVPNESPPPGAPTDMHISLQFELGEFDEAVSVDPPEDDEVVNLDEVPELRTLLEQSF